MCHDMAIGTAHHAYGWPAGPYAAPCGTARAGLGPHIVHTAEGSVVTAARAESVVVQKIGEGWMGQGSSSGQHLWIAVRRRPRPTLHHPMRRHRRPSCADFFVSLLCLASTAFSFTPAFFSLPIVAGVSAKNL